MTNDSTDSIDSTAVPSSEVTSNASVQSLDAAPSPPPPLPAENQGARLAQTGLLLAIETLALVLGISALVLGDALAPSLSNRFPPQSRNGIVIAIVVALAVTVGSFLKIVHGKNARHLAFAHRLAQLSAPLVPLAALPALLQAGVWFRRPLDFLVLLVPFALISERCLRLFFDAWSELAIRPRPGSWLARFLESRRAPLAVVVFAGCAYAAYTSHLTILQHQRLGTGAFDLAIFDNMMWNALHGKPFRSTVMFGLRPGSALADHAHFGMLFFVPFYALYPRAESLLVLQAVLLGLASVPLYLFAQTLIGRWSAAIVALAYLLYTPLHGAQFYDFHWLPLAVFFHFLLFYAIAIRKNWLVVASVVVLFSLREDVAPGIAVLGLFLMITGARIRMGAALLVTASLWFALVKFAIMPWFGQWWFAEMYKDLVAPHEKGFGSVIRTLLVNPIYVLTTLLSTAKLEYALHLFAPLALIPLRRPALAILAFPGFFFTLLTTWGPAISIRYQYTTHWIAYVFAATVIYLSLLEKRSATSPDASSEPQTPHRPAGKVLAMAALGAVVLAMICHSTVFGVVLKPTSFVGGNVPVRFSMDKRDADRYRALRSLADRIPQNASVTATDIEAPHVSNRMDCFAIAQDATAGEYLLLNPASFHLSRTKQNVITVLDSRPYGLVAKAGGMYLFQAGHKSPETAAALRTVRQLTTGR